MQITNLHCETEYRVKASGCIISRMDVVCARFRASSFIIDDYD